MYIYTHVQVLKYVYRALDLYRNVQCTYLYSTLDLCDYIYAMYTILSPTLQYIRPVLYNYTLVSCSQPLFRNASSFGSFFFSFQIRKHSGKGIMYEQTCVSIKCMYIHMCIYTERQANTSILYVPIILMYVNVLSEDSHSCTVGVRL